MPVRLAQSPGQSTICSPTLPPTKSKSEQAFTLQFVSFVGNVKAFLMIICAAVTFTILLVSANTIAMSVRERIEEIGILRTLGYTSGTILFLILGEVGVLALLGGAVGLLFAFGLTDVVRHGLSITPDVAGALLALAFLVGIISSFVPAYNASRTSILESLRNSG
jgi:putative ABC transport system permease protein